jgi:hypothetical protein
MMWSRICLAKDLSREQVKKELRKFLFLLLCFWSTNDISFSQEVSFVVPAGSRINDAIPAKHLYQYPDFISGKVFFRDGSVSEAPMNYNRLTDEMLFISQSGDTLAIDNEPIIRVLVINKDSFFFDNGYIMLLSSHEGLRLGVKHTLKITEKRKTSGYDMESTASSISSYRSFTDGMRMYELKVKEDAIIAEHSLYYFGDRFNHFELATQKKLLELFPDCQAAIRKFCRKNAVDYGNQNSLSELMSFVGKSCW